MDARSARVSIPVDGCLGGNSVAGGVPLPPPMLGPTEGLIAGGDGSGKPAGGKTCCARGDEVMPGLDEPERVLRKVLGVGPGVERDDCEEEES